MPRSPSADASGWLMACASGAWGLRSRFFLWGILQFTLRVNSAVDILDIECNLTRFGWLHACPLQLVPPNSTTPNSTTQ